MWAFGYDLKNKTSVLYQLLLHPNVCHSLGLQLFCFLRVNRMQRNKAVKESLHLSNLCASNTLVGAEAVK